MSVKKEVQKDSSNNKQKNYVRNYIILLVIFGSCVALTLYFCKWYEVYKEYQKEIPIIRDSLLEITREDLDHYVIDNSSVIIYMCTANDDSCRSFEKDFKKYIGKNDITDQVIYLNLSGVNISDFVHDFNETYHFKTRLNSNYPAFVVFQDGKVISILQESKNKKITISSVQQFLELNLADEEEAEQEENYVVEEEEA